jgi:hypothetical protein
VNKRKKKKKKKTPKVANFAPAPGRHCQSF